MTKRSWTGTVVAMSVVASVALAAQAPSTSSAQATASPRAQTAITVTGCVLKADQPPAAATAEAPAAGASATQDARFILTNVVPGGASEPTGTSGAVGNASSVKYPLGADASKLTPHVGHRVEITGTFEAPGAAAVGTSSVPTLKVDSLKMVSSTCANSAQR